MLPFVLFAYAADPFATRVLELTNRFRQANGLPALKADASLSDAAQRYAETMADRGWFSHQGPDGSSPMQRAHDAGYPSWFVGENIAAGQRTPEEVVQAWIASPGHRANLLGTRYEEIGIGQAPAKSGAIYWVQDFGAR